MLSQAEPHIVQYAIKAAIYYYNNTHSSDLLHGMGLRRMIDTPPCMYPSSCRICDCAHVLIQLMMLHFLCGLIVRIVILLYG
jgi:hypothetical protein